MPYAVSSTTGHPFRRGGHVFQPHAATIIPDEDLTDEMRAEVNNLRIEEVSGSDDPKLAGRAVLDAEGQGVNAPPAQVAPAGGVGHDEYLALAAERDGLKTENEALRTQSVTLTTAKEAAESSVTRLTTERDEALAAKQAAEASVTPAGPSDGALSEAIDAVLSASSASLARLPNDALAKLCAIKGISPIPDTADGLVAALKPAP